MSTAYTITKRSLYLLTIGIFTILMSAVALHSTAEAACDPGPGQVSFYVDSQFRGACSVRGIGDYPNSGAIGLPNDSISSIRIGQNAQTVICRDNDFGRDCILVTTDTPLLTALA